VLEVGEKFVKLKRHRVWSFPPDVKAVEGQAPSPHE
jgi:hypothetical protein